MQVAVSHVPPPGSGFGVRGWQAGGRLGFRV
jgi:hypothetical protein